MAGDFSPGFYAVKFTAGNQYARTLAFGPVGAPMNLVGVTASLQVRGGGVLLLSATTANGMLAINGPAGTVAITLPPAATALPPGLYPYDLLLTFPGGNPQTWLAGTCQVTDSVNGP